MRFEDFKADLKKEIAPVYLLCGGESFLLSSAKNMLSQLVDELPEINIERLNAPTLAQVLDQTLVYPMASRFRVVFIEGFALDKQDPKRLIDFAKTKEPACVLVFVNADESCNKALGFAAKQIDCNQISAQTVKNWIIAKSSKSNKTISMQDANYLAELCGFSMTLISNQMGKLCNIDGAQITKQDIDVYVEPITEYTVFQLLDFIMKKDAHNCFKLLDYMRVLRTEPMQILSTLYSSMRRIFFVAISSEPHDRLAALLGVKPFAINFAIKNRNGASPKRLLQMCELLAQTESNIKQGKTTVALALHATVLQLLNI